MNFSRGFWGDKRIATIDIRRAIPGRHSILEKLTAFHRDHDTEMAPVLRDLKCTIDQVPPREFAVEAKPLAEELNRIQDGRRRGPQPLGDILPGVLARLEGSTWYNRRSQGSDLCRLGFTSRERLLSPRGKPSEKLGALSDHQRLIRHLGVTALIYQYDETVIAHERDRLVKTRTAFLGLFFLKPLLGGGVHRPYITAHLIGTWHSFLVFPTHGNSNRGRI